MTAAIEEAAPRSAGEAKNRVWIHPTDLEMMCDWLHPRVEDEIANTVLEDASQALQS